MPISNFFRNCSLYCRDTDYWKTSGKYLVINLMMWLPFIGIISAMYLSDATGAYRSGFGDGFGDYDEGFLAYVNRHAECTPAITCIEKYSKDAELGRQAIEKTAYDDWQATADMATKIFAFFLVGFFFSSISALTAAYRETRRTIVGEDTSVTDPIVVSPEEDRRDHRTASSLYGSGS